MRVITGSRRGRRLETLGGEDITRPTSQNVKEAIFSMIQFEIEGKRALDLFAGSGQLGIEALSRGATFCTFVENNKQAKAVVERNIEHCGLGDCAQVVLTDAISFTKRNAKYDLVFLDPPYHTDLIVRAMQNLQQNVSDDGIIICETASDEKLPENFADFSVYRVKRHGKTKISVYRKGND